MAFKTPGKPLQRSRTLNGKAGMKRGTGLNTKPKSPEDQRKAQQVAMQKATLRLLEKARRDADAAGVTLSEWETGFIEGVSERVKTYGRAFADPDKGAMNGTLSLRQGVKLKEIRKKVAKPAEAKSRER